MRPPSTQDSTGELDLTPPPELDPSSEAALRAAFNNLAISRQMTFAKAMSIPHLATCIRTCSQIAVRKLTRSRR